MTGPRPLAPGEATGWSAVAITSLITLVCIAVTEVAVYATISAVRRSIKGQRQ